MQDNLSCLISQMFSDVADAVKLKVGGFKSECYMGERDIAGSRVTPRLFWKGIYRQSQW